MRVPLARIFRDAGEILTTRGFHRGSLFGDAAAVPEMQGPVCLVGAVCAAIHPKKEAWLRGMEAAEWQYGPAMSVLDQAIRRVDAASKPPQRTTDPTDPNDLRSRMVSAIAYWSDRASVNNVKHALEVALLEVETPPC